MTPIIQEDATECRARGETAEALSIYHAMEHLSDGRRKQGQCSPLALVLTSILLAKASAETSVLGISEWIRLRAAWLKKVMPQAGPRFPCAATSSNV